MSGSQETLKFHKALVTGVRLGGEWVEYGPVYILLPINLGTGSSHQIFQE